MIKLIMDSSVGLLPYFSDILLFITCFDTFHRLSVSSKGQEVSMQRRPPVSRNSSYQDGTSLASDPHLKGKTSSRIPDGMLSSSFRP